MTSSSQNIFSYSSLIGFFYQHGIGCEADEIKAFEIFSNAFKNNHKTSSDDTKNLNEVITQYFYSLFLYKDVIKLEEIITNYTLKMPKQEMKYHNII